MIAILLLIFFLVSLIALFPWKNSVTKIFVFSFLGLLLILIAAFRSEEGNPDYEVYVSYFYDQDFLLVEPTFVIFAKMVSFLFGPYPIYIFIIYAILGVTLKFAAIKQLSKLWFLSIIVYIGNFFVLQDMIQIRAGVASALLLLCIKPIFDRDLKKFLFISILAILFHISALVILPLWFLPKIKDRILIFLLYIIIPISCVIYFLKTNLIMALPIPVVQEKIDIYVALQESGVENVLTEINVFNYVFLVNVLIFYLLLIKHKLLLFHNKYALILLAIYGIGLSSYAALATLPVFAGRISGLLEIVEIILIPFLYYTISPKYISKLLVIFWALGMILIHLFRSKLIS